ncbi:MAG TPA: NUDIX domain-containing protein [Anaerolineae bacterium]|nr:NUDIX domain-containing protein [Anaerolineae bacterium]
MNWRDAALRVLLAWWRLMRPTTIGVRGIVVDETGKLLLVRHSYGARKWFLPGGGHRGDESPDQALVREMREETGIQVEVTRLVGVYFYNGQHKRDHIYVFACRAIGGESRLVGGEIEAIGWFPPDALPSNLMIGMDRILDDWRRGVPGFGPLHSTTRPHERPSHAKEQSR